MSESCGWAQAVKTLEGGADHAYSAAAFNNSGSLLATVGAYPDFMLTLWDWAAGKTLLRSKAFSQEVFTVSFSPYSATSLVTSGGLGRELQASLCLQVPVAADVLHLRQAARTVTVVCTISHGSVVT